jgi:hypothetical protein
MLTLGDRKVSFWYDVFMSEELPLGKDTFTGAVSYLALEASLPTEAKAEDTNLSAESIEAIATKFGYHTELDQNGLTRQVYKLGDVSFSFVGREETPLYPAIEHSRPTRLGQEPWRLHSPNHREEYAKEINEQASYEPTLAQIHEQNQDLPEHFVAERSSYGIYLLLSRLQPENLHWQEQANAMSNNQYDAEVLKTIDMATAVNNFYSQEQIEGQHEPTLGEIVAVAVLLGDTEAQQIADQAVQLQREQEEAVIRSQLERMNTSSDQSVKTEAFKPSDLVVVHTTRYKPKETSDGYKVSTTHDVSGLPRSTVHTSLNHKVENDIWYGWDDADYALISPFDQMLATNGTPKSLNGADTWWTRNPGEPLLFPAATLIMPGGDQEELVVDTDQGQRKYKSGGLAQADIDNADTVMPGTREHIMESLQDPQGQAILIESPEGQRIIANALRDALIQQEIAVKRGLKVEKQYDDKHMTQEFNHKIYKMATELQLPLTASLHTTSEEAEVEIDVSRGIRRDYATDPKVRRVAYASGFASGGGDARIRSKRSKRSVPGA